MLHESCHDVACIFLSPSHRPHRLSLQLGEEQYGIVNTVELASNGTTVYDSALLRRGSLLSVYPNTKGFRRDLHTVSCAQYLRASPPGGVPRVSTAVCCGQVLYCIATKNKESNKTVQYHRQ